jgi:hypothetical protein
MYCQLTIASANELAANEDLGHSAAPGDALQSGLDLVTLVCAQQQDNSSNTEGQQQALC